MEIGKRRRKDLAKTIVAHDTMKDVMAIARKEDILERTGTCNVGVVVQVYGSIHVVFAKMTTLLTHASAFETKPRTNGTKQWKGEAIVEIAWQEVT